MFLISLSGSSYRITGTLFKKKNKETKTKLQKNTKKNIGNSKLTYTNIEIWFEHLNDWLTIRFIHYTNNNDRYEPATYYFPSLSLSPLFLFFSLSNL